MNLYLGTYLKDLTAGCCPGKVYALVMTQDHQALRQVAPNVWDLDSYSAASHIDFAIPLNEHPERTLFYYLDLDESQFTLPANERGRWYTVEYWRRELADTIYNRSQDTLEHTEKFLWSGTTPVESQLGELDISTISDRQAHISVSYDSETLTLHCMAHLEQNGQLVVNPIQMTATLYDDQGQAVSSIIRNTFLTNVPGVYSWDYPALDLNPDRVYACVVEIIGPDTVLTTTVSYLNSWD